ncbi:aggregation-promoting factor C-terminal-like domain-containing protein [Fructobacillus ficulneus]|nr:LysM peptidoglycan-binding domain-containing protein [Fructobacillus ficulneus]
MKVKKQMLLAAGLLGSVVAGHQAASADQVQKHTVTAGETLTAVANQFHTTVSQLAQDNQITNVDRIYQGQELMIGVTSADTNQNQSTSATATSTAATTPANGSYQVQAGDTLWSLAQRFNVAVGTLAQQNNITNADQIFVGQTLQVAGTAQAPAQSATSQSQSQAPTSQSESQAPQSQSQAPAQSTQATPSATTQAAQPTQTASNQSEDQALQTLIMKESSGNVNARNGIYFGLGQLSPQARAVYGGNSTDYQDQLQAMKAYISARYGSAEAALAHHLQTGWY